MQAGEIARGVKGKEQYIVAFPDGKRGASVHVYDVDGRVTPQRLSDRFPNAHVFLRCRNLNGAPARLRGCCILLPYEKKIVQVIEASWGAAYVLQLFPPTPKPKRFVTTLVQEAHLLQQQVGAPLGEFNDSQMKVCRQVQEGKVVALVDGNGFSKHNTCGPDVLTLDDTHVIPDSQKGYLAKQVWVMVPPKVTVPKLLSLAEVAVVYVYAPDIATYRKVLTYEEGGKQKSAVTMAAPRSISCNSDR
jgi:hypothetical protein